MKIYCPSCRELVAAADIDLASGWGKCVACQEVFELSSMIPDFRASAIVEAQVIERPFNARAIVERSRDELDVFIPRQGFRAATLGLLGFATFWLAFIAFWTAGALGIVFGNGWPPNAANIGFAAFSTPFWLVGFGMLGGVAWSAFGTKHLRLDRQEMRTDIRCLFYRRSRTIDRGLVQRARLYVPNVQNQNGVQESSGAEVIFEKGSFVLPADDKAEADWLVFEINEFLKA